MHSSLSLPPYFSLSVSLPLVLGKSSYPELAADLDLGSFLYSDHEATGVLIVYNIICRGFIAYPNEGVWSMLPLKFTASETAYKSV